MKNLIESYTLNALALICLTLRPCYDDTNAKDDFKMLKNNEESSSI